MQSAVKVSCSVISSAALERARLNVLALVAPWWLKNVVRRVRSRGRRSHEIISGGGAGEMFSGTFVQRQKGSCPRSLGNHAVRPRKMVVNGEPLRRMEP